MSRMYNLGMPYMGSKRKLSKPIIDFILEQHPNAKYFYDLFGGGGAMSFEALQRPQFKTVVYNECNTGVVRLLEDIIKNGITDKYYEWIDRETFDANKDKGTWLGGLCKVIWSFGNNQKDYLFGKEIEEEKRLLHEIVVNKCKKSLISLNKKLDIELIMPCDKFGHNIKSRRLDICGQIKNKMNRCDIQQLERLEQLEQLQIYNLSYEQVPISTDPNETIIYLDPPYANTTKYEKSISHKDFYEYVEKLHKAGYIVYVSSYESHMPCVLEIEHSCSLSATTNNKVTEKLFSYHIPKEKIKLIQGELF